MSIGRFLMYLALMSALAPSAFAEVSIRSMNYPAWVERGEERVPVAPGDRLQAGDVLQTGDSGRVWLQVRGGHVIKLGQATRLAFGRADYRGEGEDAVFIADFNLLQGVFRYTSGFFVLEPPARNELEFTIGTGIVEVDSADVLVRAADDVDQLILAEGRIAIIEPGQPAVIMDEPSSRYRKARARSEGTVDRIDAATLENLRAESELDSSLGIAKVTGLKVLVLRSLANPGRAEQEVARLQQAGYAARARIVEIDGVAYTRVQLEGLASRAEAENLQRALIEAGLIDDAWIDVKNHQ